MLKIYPAIFHNEEGYWVEFPDLPGCQSCGATLEETMALAEEALGLYLADILEQGKKLPEPTSFNKVSSDDENALISYVTTDVSRYRRDTRAVKKTLSIPAWLAKEAKKNNLSLSKVLQEGIKKRLGL